MVMMEQFTDSKLVQMARAEDKDAFRQLVERYQGMAMYLARRFTKNEEVARELVQESLLQAYLSLDKLHEEAHFKSWFYALVLNVCRSWWRAQKYTTISLDAQDNTKQKELSSYLMQGAHEQWAERELQHQVWEAVALLPLPNQEVISLFYYEGLSMQEIATLLQISLPTVKGRLHKGRHQLRLHFREFRVEGKSNSSGKKKINFFTEISTKVVHTICAPIHNSYHKGKNMQNEQQNMKLLEIALCVCLALASLALWRNVVGPDSLSWMLLWPAFYAAIYIPIKALTRWLGLPTSLRGGVSLLIGIMLSVPLINLTNANHYSVEGLFGFFGFWVLLSGLFTRNAKGLYVALHLANWFFAISLVELLIREVNVGDTSVLFLLIPFDIMLLLLYFYKPIVKLLTALPLFQASTPPKSDREKIYEQEHYPLDENGENRYRDGYQSEGPIANYPELPAFSPPQFPH